MTALNVSKAWESNLNRIYSQRLYDLEVRLNASITSDTILSQIRKNTEVRYAEGWSSHPTSFAGRNPFEITHTYPDKGHGSFMIQALPYSSQLINPTIMEGEWLKNGTDHEVVLNQMVKVLDPSLQIGDSIVLSHEGKSMAWQVIGFTEDVGASATAYVSGEVFSKRTHDGNRVNVLRISYKDRSIDNAIIQNQKMETFFASENVPVRSTIPVWLLHNAIAAHMKVLVNSLMAMAILMAFVGIIGLMSVISMNVLERTREIGVMRAIGATPGKISKLIIWEGMLIGIMSISISFVLSIILSISIGRLIGNMAFRTPLSRDISLVALVLWMVLIIVGAYFATLFPAKRANKITTREALSYE